MAESNYYYDRIKREQGEDVAKGIMRKIAPAGGKASRGGFGTEKVNKNGLTGREQARLSGSKGGKVSRKKASK